MMMSARLTLTALFSILALPAAADLSWRLVNESGMTLMELYSGADGSDLLGVRVLAAGQSGTYTVPAESGQCQFDLHFILEDGREITDSVNLCEQPSYTLRVAQ